MSIQILSGPAPLDPLPKPTTQDLDELFFARRALSLLKSRLGRENIKRLLAEDIEAGNTFWEKAVQDSQGKPMVRFSVTLFAPDLKASDFLGWFKGNLTNLPVMLGAHPEHYINGHEVLETVGGHVSLFDLQFHGEVPGWVRASGELDGERWPIVLCASGVLKNGTVIATACHQFGDVEGGMEACVGGWVPAEVVEEVIEMQRRHLAVEWRNWMEQARTELRVAQR